MRTIEIQSLLNPECDHQDQRCQIPTKIDWDHYNEVKGRIYMLSQQLFKELLERGPEGSTHQAEVLQSFCACADSLITDPELTTEQIYTLTKILHNQSKSLLTLIKENEKLGCIEKGINLRYYLDSRSSKSLKRKMAFAKTKEISPRNRLSRKNVDILEGWYSSNRDDPYLKEQDLCQLLRTTFLNETQIKNWVANRRRKEKRSKVSYIVSSIFL